jgi:hypothetical protein
MRSFLISGLLVLLPFNIAFAESAGSSAREGCVADARSKFSSLVERSVRTLIGRKKTEPNSYMTAPSPKAFAMCINWQRTKPQFRVGRAWAIASARVSPDATVVTSTALGRCTEAARNQQCECVIVHRDGQLVISFPEWWPRDCQ